MKPETAAWLEKARDLLLEARAIHKIRLNEAAVRSAYLAGFHAAQAFIFERTGKAPKTHRGVQTEFLRLTKDDVLLDPELRIFLSQSFNLKAVADYETGLRSKISPEVVAAAIETAERFVARVAQAIWSPGAT